MTLIDRYILRMYFRVLLICGISFCGIYIVADAFNNLEEFITYGESHRGGALGVLADYYQPRALTFLNMTGGLLALMAAVFTVTWLQRSRELTALLAAGVSGIRVAAPMVGAAVAVAALGAVNREVWIPSFRDSLSRNAQNWLGENPRPVEARYDHTTSIYLDGRQTLARDKRIVDPNFRLPRSLRSLGRKLVGKEAVRVEAAADRPGGFLFNEVRQPLSLLTRESISLNGSPAILTPRDTPWLEPNQCFVVSNVKFEQLAHGAAWRQYASAAEMIEALHNPSLDYGADVRVTIHSRFVQPLLDVLLVLIGIPLVMRTNQNVFAAVGKCFLVVVVFWMLVLGSQHAGGAYLLRPALAAWLPVIILAPIAVLLLHSLWE